MSQPTPEEVHVRDRDVRRALLAHLRHRHPEPDTLFVDELDLGGLVRVDVAAVNGSLWGYEIKSERDTLRRLPMQVEVYSRVLDHAALVVADNHHEHAMELVPEWWEVYCATMVDNSVELLHKRLGRRNPDVDPLQLAQLLWREEALGELTERGLDRGVRSKPRKVIWQRLADSLPLEELKDVVRYRLKTRTGWRDSG